MGQCVAGFSIRHSRSGLQLALTLKTVNDVRLLCYVGINLCSFCSANNSCIFVSHVYNLLNSEIGELSFLIAIFLFSKLPLLTAIVKYVV
jgi:hypothetical protein